MLKKLLLAGFFLAIFLSSAMAQQSVARQWNEVLLQAIREDFARPPVHARNLFHTSIALYDAWAAYDSVAQTYFLGKTVGNYTCPFNGVPVPADIKAAREEAMSFAVYRVLTARFSSSPNAGASIARFNNLMTALGYNYLNTATNYQSGSPAALGNYIGFNIRQMGLQDGANELGNYAIQYYQTVNPSLVMVNPGNPTILDPNRWQRLMLPNAIDQNGNPIPSTQVFQSPEWGLVQPFALTPDDLTIYQRNNHDYWVYHDPGPMPFLDTIDGGGTSEEYKWHFSLVSAWGAHNDPNDGVMWDISPRSIGNVQSYPQTPTEYHDFYDFTDGKDPGIGRDTNPRTGQPYQTQIAPRGDYTRALAQFWADGPNSETPPGHWFSILNYVSDHPSFVKKFNGKGPLLDDLEWDVKAYFTLGATLHDAAITAWGIKGWYDGTRPVSALRYMADKGQSSDPNLPRYHPAGLKLIPDLIEQVQAGDPLAGVGNLNVGKIKLYTWRGPLYVTDTATQIAGVGWILAENWWPYQRKTFVTPPFAGYISGHSTFSRSAAETLTSLTGDEFFPGGMGEFHIAANSNFLGLEKGPSVDLALQWATYRDASDQTSLSRIWGGIHPPFDDIPGRLIGIEIAADAYQKAKTYFYKDEDNDGHFTFEDCDDSNPAIYDGAPELCDNLDNDCNGMADDLPVFTYFVDNDGDGYGNAATSFDTCLTAAPAGFVANNLDCDDADAALNPNAAETCDGLDNDCDGMADDLSVFTYFVDNDGDGYGNAATSFDTCLTAAPAGFVANNLDCDDADAALNPNAAETCDGLDNDCDGMADDLPVFTYFVDNDGDGYGNAATSFDTCLTAAPAGFVENDLDCDDADAALNPNAAETCDGLDNDCDGMADDLPVFTYFVDNDGDGYGNAATSFDTCLTAAPAGFVENDLDCDDSNAAINPDAVEVVDGLDNDCNGQIDDVSATRELWLQVRAHPNPVTDMLTIYQTSEEPLHAQLMNIAGQVLREQSLLFSGQQSQLDFSDFPPGLYFLKLSDKNKGREALLKVVKLER